MPYGKIKDINFTNCNKQQNNQESTLIVKKKRPCTIFFKALTLCPAKLAILSPVNPYLGSYVPKTLHPDLRLVLSVLFDQALTQESYENWLQISILKLNHNNVTPEQHKAVEEKTRCQADSRLWF